MRLSSAVLVLVAAIVLHNGVVDARDGKCHPYFKVAKSIGPVKAGQV
jgi:hypothetical protein